MKPRVLSLFSGAGGIDFGFEAAGFTTTATVELDADCCMTLRRNRKWRVIEGDIFEVATQQMLDAGGLSRADVDVLIGGPPCQPFSKAGYWATGDSMRLNDPRADTLKAYLRVVEEAKPKVILLENVRGLAYAGKDDGLQLLLRGLQKINARVGTNYRPVVEKLNAADFGVPQLRERLFMVASRDGRPFEFPARRFRSTENNSDSLFADSDLTPYRTAWDAIGDVIPGPDEDLRVRGKWADLLPSIPEGSNYLWHTDRGGGRPLFGWRRRYWTFLLKLAKNRPSWTIQAQPGPAIGPFHWDNRRLSMRELCRLQTFPDNVVVTGSHTSVQKQLGNAVPSLLAEVLAREIRVQLLRLAPLRSDLKLLPPVRTPVPGPNNCAAVPQAYTKLEGRHTAHPGTGLGNAARLRAIA